MKRTRYSEEQIIGILTEHEAGAKCADLCRKHGMSEGTFYAWKAKFGGMTVSDAKRLKALEDENAKLKTLLAEQMLDAAAMKEWCVSGARDARRWEPVPRSWSRHGQTPGGRWISSMISSPVAGGSAS